MKREYFRPSPSLSSSDWSTLLRYNISFFFFSFYHKVWYYSSTWQYFFVVLNRTTQISIWWWNMCLEGRCSRTSGVLADSGKVSAAASQAPFQSAYVTLKSMRTLTLGSDCPSCCLSVNSMRGFMQLRSSWPLSTFTPWTSSTETWSLRTCS